MLALAHGLWIHDQAFMGLTHGLRTTIVRMENGRLWVHSPTELTPELRDQLEALGEVGCLVAANNHHHRWLLQWHEAYPGADVFVSGGIPRKRPRLQRYQVLEHTSDPPWRSVLAQAFMGGLPFLDETVFLHRETASLIVTDFVQNHGDPIPIGWAAKLAVPIFARLGFRDLCVAPPVRMRWLRRDATAFDGFLRQIAEWPVQRIIVTHGRLVEGDGRQQLDALCVRSFANVLTP